jgi:hypothetical protein
MKKISTVQVFGNEIFEDQELTIGVELSHVRLGCLRSEEPLAADEIARRILPNGYSSRSKTFTVYVRRLLKQDGSFVANAEGLWMLRAAA